MYNYFNPMYPQQPNQNYQNNYIQPTQQTVYHPLTFVSGIEGAKAFIVNPNQTIYLIDSDSDKLFIKSADSNGRYTIQTKRIVDVDIEAPKINYVTLDDFNALKEKVEGILNAK